MSNVDFVRGALPALHPDRVRAESYLAIDPRSACYSRRPRAVPRQGHGIPARARGQRASERLRRNRQLTPDDVSVLEQMLVDAGGRLEHIGSQAEGSGGLGLFIRSLVGSDRSAAEEAFAEFLTASGSRSTMCASSGSSWRS